MKRIYIAGIMGRVGAPTWNFDAFDAARDKLKADGWVPISPADMDRIYEGWGKYPKEGLVLTSEDKARFMKRDLAAIEICDAIYMLDGWKTSTGARLEHAYAQYIGLQIIEE
jgi:hypothetical protein